MQIEKIKAPLVLHIKRVAAYARVSVTELEHSLTAQMDYYENLIKANPEWRFAGIYADNGISGTSTKRAEFQRLIKDCEAGLVDIILVKSISRFARNTVDMLNTIRHLKDIGVEVRFEREHINTLSGDGELMLTLLASFAQAESESISRNIKWAARKGFENGEPNTGLRCFGYNWENKTLVVNEEEAKWVRYIYDRFLSGVTLNEIAREMKDVKSIRGLPINSALVRRILTSRLYVGDLLLQRYYNPSVGKCAKNEGEMPMYEIRDNHEAIISREVFEQAQKKVERLKYGRTPFAGRIKCGRCGSACKHRHQKNLPYATIECKNRCGLHHIREDKLLEITDGSEDMVLFDDRIVFSDRTVKRKLSDQGYHKTRFSRRTFCGVCGNTYTRQNNHGVFVWGCRDKNQRKTCDNKLIKEEELLKAAEWAVGSSDEMDYFCNVERADVYKDKVIFHTKEGDKIWQRT